MEPGPHLQLCLCAPEAIFCTFGLCSCLVGKNGLVLRLLLQHLLLLGILSSMRLCTAAPVRGAWRAALVHALQEEINSVTQSRCLRPPHQQLGAPCVQAASRAAHLELDVLLLLGGPGLPQAPSLRPGLAELLLAPSCNSYRLLQRMAVLPVQPPPCSRPLCAQS